MTISLSANMESVGSVGRRQGASTTVVLIRRLVAAVVVKTKRRRGCGWLMESRGSNCTKGVNSGRWAATGEIVGFGRGSDGRNIMVGRCSSSYACFCRGYKVGIIWREKKSYFPTKVGNVPGEVGKNSTRKSGTIVLGTVVSYDTTTHHKK